MCHMTNDRLSGNGGKKNKRNKGRDDLVRSFFFTALSGRVVSEGRKFGGSGGRRIVLK